MTFHTNPLVDSVCDVGCADSPSPNCTAIKPPHVAQVKVAVNFFWIGSSMQWLGKFGGDVIAWSFPIVES